MADGSAFDALIVGAGPAGLMMASALAQTGISVCGLSPTAPTAPWSNTYGVWADELAALGMSDVLGARWSDVVAYFGAEATPLPRTYGLFDKEKLQTYLLDKGDGTLWKAGYAATLTHTERESKLTTDTGEVLTARIVIDATGHKPALIQRQRSSPVAYQAAYGVVGKFSKPPTRPNQFVLMDYRADHLPPDERREPPTFVYKMDFGEDIYFVEETSLADTPALSFDALKRRLEKRLAYRGIQVTEVHHVEKCLFPMNSPLPVMPQPVLGFGGAASMVHPASGYMLGAMLRRVPDVAGAIATALYDPMASPHAIARAGWQALWPSERLRKHYIYLFGMETLMRFDQPRICQFFDTFFKLPQEKWSGFLADSLTTPELLGAMLHLFGIAPNPVRGGLMRSVGTDGMLLVNALSA
ncbi:MAG: lycopene beta cyclase [Cyanobacteria bacterium P01_A01_bin.105]